MTQEDSILLAQQIALLNQDVAFLVKRNKALERQIQGLISSQLTLINAGFMEDSDPEMAKKLRSAAFQNLEALKESILKSERR